MRGWLTSSVMLAMLGACDADRPIDGTAAPATPAQELTALELTALEHKLIRIDLALARLDPSMHALRIEWPGETVDRWRWPTWITQASQAETLDELLSAAATSPSMPELDIAVTEYARQMTTARACIRAAIDYLDRRALRVAPPREDSLYVASLATSIGLNLLEDVDRLAQARSNYSSSPNTSQVAKYFADQFKTAAQVSSPSK